MLHSPRVLVDFVYTFCLRVYFLCFFFSPLLRCKSHPPRWKSICRTPAHLSSSCTALHLVSMPPSWNCSPRGGHGGFLQNNAVRNDATAGSPRASSRSSPGQDPQDGRRRGPGRLRPAPREGFRPKALPAAQWGLLSPTASPTERTGTLWNLCQSEGRCSVSVLSVWVIASSRVQGTFSNFLLRISLSFPLCKSQLFDSMVRGFVLFLFVCFYLSST